VILVGTVGRDPEITHIPGLDKDVAKFGLATTDVFMDKTTNQFQEVTEWHNIVAWGYTAKKVERSVSKGSLILVEGRLKTRKWKDQNNIERRTTEIYADSVVALERSSTSKERESAPSMGKSTGSSPYNNSPSGPINYDDFPSSHPGYQEPPEMQIDDLNDIPYDDSDPF